MPMDYSGGSGWYVYNPEYNAVMTAAELDLFKRLQSGDPNLQAQYKAKYGEQGCITYDPAGCAWLNQWGRDQDYWNARYLNQLSSPERMAQIQRDTLPPNGYPYSIHDMNAIKQMMAAGTVNAYFAGFTDQNLAGYLAAVVGISLQGKQNDLTVGLQPPTFTPTTVGQGLPETPVYEPPSISGPIPPSPTTTGISGPTTVQPPTITGVSPSPSSTPTAMPGGTAQTQPPTVTLAPSPATVPMPTPTSMIPQQQPNVMLWVVVGAVVLAVVIYAAKK